MGIPGLAAVSFAIFLQQAPVPDPNQQKEAEKLIREIFKEEYAKKTAADRGALGQKLLRQAQETTDDPVTRFVLLREARDLAAQAGDLQTSMKSIELTAAAYAVDALPLRNGVFLALAKIARTPEEIGPLLAAWLKLVDEALARDEYDVARQAAEGAAGLARRLKDLPSVTRADAKAREAVERREKFAKIRKAQETLANSPEDPQANGVVGQFECHVKGDWEQGLLKLAKSSDPALKAQAEADLARPADASTQIRVGDGWWDVAEKAEPSHKPNLQERARFWYRLALSEAQGLTRARLETRLTGSWIPIFDGRTLGFIKDSSQPDWEVVDGVLCKRPETNAGLQSRQLFQDGEFRMRFELKGLKHMTVAVRQGVNGKDCVLFMDPVIVPMEGNVHELLFQCRGPEVKATLDGKPLTFYTRGPVVEGHIQIVGNGQMLKIFSLEYRRTK